jgi:cytochrome c
LLKHIKLREFCCVAAGLAAFICVGLPAQAEGDIAYGEYLAGECVVCHRSDGEMEGIPAIIGWDEDIFLEVMQAYRSGERTNDAMRSVVQPLGQDELEALAAYFKKLGE